MTQASCRAILLLAAAPWLASCSVEPYDVRHDASVRDPGTAPPDPGPADPGTETGDPGREGVDPGPSADPGWDAGASGGAVVLTGQHPIRGFVADSTRLYWTSFDYQDKVGSVVSLDPAGGQPVVLATAPGAQYLAVADGLACWTDWISGEVVTVPVGGGDRHVLATGHPHADRIAVAAGRVYWSDFDGFLWSVPVEGGPEVRETDGTDVAAPGPIETDGQSLFAASGAGAVFRRDLATGSDWVELAPADHAVTAMVVDTTHVYWSNLNQDRVRRVPKAGGPVETLFSDEQATDLAIDGDFLYYTAPNDCIRRMPKAGGTPESLVSESLDCNRLLVLGDHVYWTTYGVDTGGWSWIGRVPK